MTINDYKEPLDVFVRQIDVHELLPQQEPFVMICSLSHFDMKCTKSVFKIPEDNIFVKDGVFTSSGLIENIAQTCAARIGYINKYIQNKDIQLGFIGAIKHLEIHASPFVGEVITTEINVEEEMFGLILASAKVTCGEHVLVNAEMKIAVKDEQAQSQ
ncbi:MAG: pseudouridylate synthase [Alloprevotella sp.]